MGYLDSEGLGHLIAKIKAAIPDISGKLDKTGTAAAAVKLSTPRYLDGVAFSGAADVSHYGQCRVEADAVEKTVRLSGYSPKVGARVIVDFEYGNTAENPTMNVNGTGAVKIMQYLGKPAGKGAWAAGELVEFVYDGAEYMMVGGYARELAQNGGSGGTSGSQTASVAAYGVCSQTYNATAKSVSTISGGPFELVVGAQVAVKFTYGNGAASPTLNVNGTGAKPIAKYGTTKGLECSSGEIVEFIYDGTNYVVVDGYAREQAQSGGSSGSYVPTTRKINNKALSSDITLTAADVGATEVTLYQYVNITPSSAATINYKNFALILINSATVAGINRGVRWEPVVMPKNTTNVFATIYPYADSTSKTIEIRQNKNGDTVSLSLGGSTSDDVTAATITAICF